MKNSFKNLGLASIVISSLALGHGCVTNRMSIATSIENESVNKKFDTADKYWKEKEYEKAIELYQKVEEKSNYLAVTSLLRVGIIYSLDLNAPKEAIEIWENLAEEYPHSFWVLCPTGVLEWISETYETMGEYKNAINTYNRIIKDFDFPEECCPGNIKRIKSKIEACREMLVAQNYEYNGDYEKAIEIYSQIIKDYSSQYSCNRLANKTKQKLEEKLKVKEIK